MGWFDEQIRQRKTRDEDVYKQALADMAETIMGSGTLHLDGSTTQHERALNAILRHHRIKEERFKSEMVDTANVDLQSQIDAAMRASGLLYRRVELKEGWQTNACGAMLGEFQGAPAAFIPHGLAAYRVLDPKSNRLIRITTKNAVDVGDTALVFYRPFPDKALKLRDLVNFIVGSLCLSDVVAMVIATFLTTLLGLLLPSLNSMLFSDFMLTGTASILLPVAVFLTGITVSRIFIATVSALLTDRVNAKMDIAVQAASLLRILTLPAPFFKTHSSGALARRLAGINGLCRRLADVALTGGLMSLFSLVYLGQIGSFAPSLTQPAFLILVLTIGFSLLNAFLAHRLSRKQMEAAASRSGMEYNLVSGVQKIRLTGAEKRAFAKWAQQYNKSAALAYNPPLLLRLDSVIQTAISLLGMVFIYLTAAYANLSVAEYMAFIVSFSLVSGAFSTLTGMSSTIASIRAALDNVRPILDAVPETAHGKKEVDRLFGGVELNNIVFRYTDDMPLVLDNLSLKIRPGQYVAIVGHTGCGKSTLIRLLLGLETPQKGAVFYDGNNLDRLDLRSLRRQIGVVMQNGKLFQGSIFSNITISAPLMTMEEAYEAAETAGIADDIRAMPMQMHTILSEGGGISGGQKQRLMIARAIAPKPRILILDEATSALDNIAQKAVSDALDRLKCTRIVVAHRLSTIRQCDRIIVLDKGKIAEDGTYDELIKQNGMFADLVARQRLDTD